MFNFVDKNRGYLFSTYDLRVVLENQVQSMRQEVESIEANRLLNTAPEDLAQYFIDKYSVNPIVLHQESWTVDEKEISVDVRNDLHRHIRDRTRPAYVPGQRIEVAVPFEGDEELFYSAPSQRTLSPPQARVRGNELILTFENPHGGTPDLRREIDALLADIQRHVEWGTAQVDTHNRSLPRTVAQAIDARRNRLLANQGLVASLGIPIRERPNAPKTYAVPTVRRKVAPTLPPASSKPYEPEPEWAMDQYEHALNVIQNMAQVMERSPSAFQSMSEEDLRQHFLVQLNGHFEGNATGETFNVSGKTDILLREKGKNLFIAECKFWKGPKAFSETIDQLLGYTAWRDTKTAILVFNRGTEMSTVLNRIPTVAQEHPNFKRALPYQLETGFRFAFHHTGDPNREFILTVIVFHVPE